MTTSKLKIGDKAPLFEANDQNGTVIRLADFLGRKIVLYFYPKDNTPGCITQACNIRDGFSLLQAKGIAVMGISVDDEKSHKRFEEKYQLPFTLIADVDKSIVEKYGLWGVKKFMGKEFMGTNRTTFLIDEHGNVAHIIEKVDTKNHTQQILEKWDV